MINSPFPPRILSALAHWSAIFGETEYLPLVAFPFVKLFQNNPLICFEVVATVICMYLLCVLIVGFVCRHFYSILNHTQLIK